MKSILCAGILLVSASHAQWSTDPNNNLIVGYGLNPEACSDGAGGCYTAYEQQIGLDVRILLERLNRYGYKPWGTWRQITGVLPSQSGAQIAEDGSGGVLVAYSDYQHDDPFGPFTSRVRVQRVDSSGNFLWGPTGVRVSASENNTGDNVIVSDGAGGCIVAWIDRVSIWGESHLNINRINSAGIRLWGDSGRVVENFGLQATPLPTIVADGRGGCYVRFSVGRLHRFDSNGNQYWPSAIRVPTDGLIMTVDNAANVCLFGGKSFGTRNGQALFTINLQKVDTTGSLLWDSLGVTLDTLNTNLSFNYAFCTQAGYSTVAWQQNTGGIWDLRTQIVRADGSTIFPFRGRPVSRIPSGKGLGGVLPSDSLTSVFVWGDTRTPGGMYAQRLDSLGRALWDTNDILLNFPQFGDMQVTTDGSGGCIGVGFHQFDFSIRALQVSRLGQLGQVITSVEDNIEQTPDEPLLFQNYPNPFNPTTTIQYQVPQGGRISLKVFDLLGREVATLADEERKADYYTVTFDASRLTSGVYFYRLHAGGFTAVKRLMVLR